MLGFTHDQRSNTAELNSLDFQPLVISNQKAQQPPPFTGQVQKKIGKTVGYSNSRDRSRQGSRSGQGNGQPPQRDRQGQQTKMDERQGWTDRYQVQTADRKFNRNELAAEQRRLRAEDKKQRNEAVREITKTQKNIRGKTIKLEQEQEKEIEELRRLIQKEQVEKARNDQVYEKQFKELEKERTDLVKLERKIQEHGVRHQKEYVQEIKVMRKDQYPSNDRGKCHQDIRGQQQGQQFEVSETEANHQRHALRQQQLQLLTQQRERAMQAQTSLNYNPTIIPLLSKASYKIISTHISTLVELFIDDLLEQQVYHLQQIELQQKLQHEKSREKNMIQDYYQALDDFVDEAEAIEDKIGRYHTMKFEDLYLPKKYPQHEMEDRVSQVEKVQFGGTCQLTGLHSDVVENIEERKDRFVRFLGNFDEYRRGHLSMFSDITEELIDEVVDKLAHEMDRGSNDFVELVFRKEFQ